MTQSLRERLLSRAVLDLATGCWNWTHRVDRDGYGRISVRTVPKLAHRVAYELVEGPIPAGMTIDHLCHNRRCINPAHMEPVSGRENTRRAWANLDDPADALGRRTRCSKGHPYDEANTYLPPSGGRFCRACRSENARRYQERHPDRMAASSRAYKQRKRTQSTSIQTEREA